MEKGWTVKTKTGRIFQPWIFETEEEARRFLPEIEELFSSQKWFVVPLEIKEVK